MFWRCHFLVHSMLCNPMFDDVEVKRVLVLLIVLNRTVKFPSVCMFVQVFHLTLQNFCGHVFCQLEIF